MATLRNKNKKQLTQVPLMKETSIKMQVETIITPVVMPVGARMKKVREVLHVDLAHVGEAFAPLGMVRADQRIVSGPVDVVADDDEVARTERGIDAAGGVGQQDRRASHAAQDLDRHRSEE